MLCPIIGCSITAAGLWIARLFTPATFALPADVTSLIIICAMFVWLTRRATKRGAEKGARYGAHNAIDMYRHTHPKGHTHTKASDRNYADGQ